MSDDIKKQHISSNDRAKWNGHIGSKGVEQHPLGDGTNAGFSTNDFSNTEKSKLNQVNTIGRNKSYIIGDVTFNTSLPSWVRLDCIASGVTGDTEPTWGTVVEGQTIVDGTVKWLICDVKHALYA